MSSDISRAPDDGQEPNTGIVAQQGRVIVDRDLNTLQTIVNTRTEAEARDLIGPSGTPDDGFAISLSEGSPPFWVPPAPLTLGQEPAFDFLIKAGTMYVGGQRVFFPAQQAGKPITYAYFDQPDWPSPSPPAFSVERRQEAVYLRVVEHELSAVEDPDLLDVALGGVDTTQRLRLVRRVERAPVTSPFCAVAWAELETSWQARGLSFDDQTMRLTPAVKLKVGFDQSKAPPDLCDPVAVGGYLGADNQLIRVAISSGGAAGSPSQPPQLLWGLDDASFLYRVSGIAANGIMLQLASDPPDAFHTPQANQVIEILRTASIIGSEPDETDPTGRRTIVRCVTEETGFVTALIQPYGPAAAGSTTKVLVLAQPLPPAYVNDTNPLFVRVWQGQQAFAIDTATDLVDPVTNTTTGVQVTISNPAAERLAIGSFWRVAVRPSTPQAVYPERLLTAPQSPDGPREWVCPLAVINWRAPPARRIQDCRQHFDNLVALTKRPAGCCTVNIAPSDITGAATLQVLIDRAAALVDRTVVPVPPVTVCLGPGVFDLPASLRLTAAHNNLTLSSCAGGVTLEAAAGAASTAFTDGLVVVTNASGVTISGLQITMPVGALPQNTLTQFQRIAQANPGGQARDAANTASMIGLRAVFADKLTIEDCGFLFPRPAGAPDVFGVALFLQGDCSGLTVRDSTFSSAMQPTFTDPAAAASIGVTTNIGVTGRVATFVAPADLAPAGGLTSSPPAVSAAPAAANLFSLDVASRVRAIALQGPVGIATRVLPPAPLIATVGVLAATNTTADLNTTGAAAELMCRLGDAIFRGNSFSNLTMTALLFGVDGRTMRLQDNNASGCVGGLWLLLNGAVPPTGDANLKEYDAVVAALTRFDEALIMMLLGGIYPLPAGVTGTGDATITPTSLFLSNNELETIPSGGQSSATLFVLANRSAIANTDRVASLVLSGNRLRSRSYLVRTIPFRAPVPTALLVVADLERCAITGNLLLNENPTGNRDLEGGSLFIIPNSNNTVAGGVAVTSQATLLAVTGNVLLGTTNLSQLLRSATAGDTWLPYNSTL